MNAVEVVGMLMAYFTGGLIAVSGAVELVQRFKDE